MGVLPGREQTTTTNNTHGEHDGLVSPSKKHFHAFFIRIEIGDVPSMMVNGGAATLEEPPALGEEKEKNWDRFIVLMQE